MRRLHPGETQPALSDEQLVALAREIHESIGRSQERRAEQSRAREAEIWRRIDAGLSPWTGEGAH